MKLFKRGSAAAVALSCATVFAQSTDVLTWFNATIPATDFVAVQAEYKDTGVWQPSAGYRTYQPFKTSLNSEGKQAYWRKDEPVLSNNWYGEIFHYDSSYIYLHSETFPGYTSYSPPSTGVWDKRPDLFRLFVGNNGAGNPAMGSGRIMAPRTYTSGWNLTNQGFEVYRCGVDSVTASLPNGTNGYLASNNQTCPSYTTTANAVDVKVSLEMRAFTYSTEYGSAPTAPADTEITNRGASVIAPASPGTYTQWPTALIINQTMYDAEAGEYARERFVFGYSGGVYYGMVAWDRSTSTNQTSWTFTHRTLGLKQARYASMSMDGFLDRSARDRTLPPPGKPTVQTFSGQTYQCVSNSNNALISWAHVGGSTQYQVRVNDLADGWNPGGAGSNDVAVTVNGTSYTFPVQAGHVYDWWVAASNSAGDADAIGIPATITPNCSGTPPASTYPSQPSNLTVTSVGDVVKLSWDHMPGATGYDIRIDDTSNSWQPNTGNDVAIDNIKSNSYIFRVPNLTHNYTWWV